MSTREVIGVSLSRSSVHPQVSSPKGPRCEKAENAACGLYRLEVTLLVFYGGLLLITPAVSGLIRGSPTTEISTRGARFAEEADDSVGQTRATIVELEQTDTVLADGLFRGNLKIEQLKRDLDDSRQQGLDSRP